MRSLITQDILNQPDEISSLRSGNMIPRRLSVDYISFSAHVDCAQNSEFIDLVNAQHVVSPMAKHGALLTCFLSGLGAR
jgi:cleavage and polyadenylation specificity factor subunit 3